MSATFEPRRLPTNAWRGWFRYAPRVALRAAPPVALAGIAVIAISGSAGALGTASAPLCLIPLAACLRARDQQVSTLSVLRRFLAAGWRPALAASAILCGLLVAFGWLATAFARVLPAALTGAAHVAPPASAVAAIASQSLPSMYITCLLPEIGFTVLLACDGVPGRVAYALAHRAIAMNFVPMMVVNVIALVMLLLPRQPWPLAPALVPVVAAVIYLAYQQTFHGAEPARACQRRAAAPAPARIAAVPAVHRAQFPGPATSAGHGNA